MTRHRDQRINAEAVDLASYEVADSGLRDTKELGRLHLGQARQGEVGLVIGDEYFAIRDFGET